MHRPCYRVDEVSFLTYAAAAAAAAAAAHIHTHTHSLVSLYSLSLFSIVFTDKILTIS
jgi:hypothetical protein